MKIQGDNQDMRVIGLSETTEASQDNYTEASVSPPKMMAGSEALLKHIHTSEHRMGSRQQDLETTVQQGLVAIMETW